MRIATTDYEDALREYGTKHVAGVDEVGRGAFAGPLVAAAVILDASRPVEGLRDSKLLTAKARDRLAAEIRDTAVAWNIIRLDADAIDAFGMAYANALVLRAAALALPIPPDRVIQDGTIAVHYPCRAEARPGADGTIACVAAASILAKTYRDALMARHHSAFPQYRFDRNKGYGTVEHRAAIAQHGPTPLHRRSFLH